MSIARARLHSDDHRFFLSDVAEAQDALAPFIQDALAPSEFLRAIAFINSISASASLRLLPIRINLKSMFPTAAQKNSKRLMKGFKLEVLVLVQVFTRYQFLF